MTNEERKIQAALGTTPYLINRLTRKNMVDLIQHHLLFPNDREIEEASIIGFIMGGLCVAISRADVEQIMKKISTVFNEKTLKKFGAKADWEALEKEIKSVIKF